MVKVGNLTLDGVNSTDEIVALREMEHLSSTRETFLIVYSIIMVIGVFSYICRSFSFYSMCLGISINLHDKIFRGISRAKMIFFNNNPSGRILNRFARDINSVDTMLPIIMIDVLDVSLLLKNSYAVSQILTETLLHFGSILRETKLFSELKSNMAQEMRK